MGKSEKVLWILTFLQQLGVVLRGCGLTAVFRRRRGREKRLFRFFHLMKEE